MSVAEAQTRIDSREFSEWMAFNRLSPFVPERGDMQAASIAWSIAVAHGATDVTPADFLIKYGEDAEPSVAMPSVEEKIRARFGGPRT